MHFGRVYKLLSGALSVLCFIGVAVPGRSAEPATDAAELYETALIAAHPHLLSREGPVLRIGEHRFTDQPDCDADDCVFYRAAGVWNGYVGVEVALYEGTGFLLVSQRHSLVFVGERPVSSPSGRRFFVGFLDERNWREGQGSSVWEWRPDPVRLRLVETALVLFTSFVTWHGDSCVEFTGQRLNDHKLEPERSYFLVEQTIDWQLADHRPEECR